MRVVIDCFKLVKGVGKSIGIYNVALNLVKNLAIAEDSNDYVVLGTKYNRDDFDIEGIEFHEIQKNPMSKLYCIWWELFDVKKYYRKYQGDAILFPRGFTTLFNTKNDIIIVHDMIPFFYHSNYPDIFNKLENAYIMWRLKSSIRNSSSIVTVSETSKDDIVKIGKVSSSKVTVIYNGLNQIDMGYKTLHEDVEADDYIVAITSSLPHKNAKGIVNSYETYCEKTETPLNLVIIGIDDVDEYNISAEVCKRITTHKFIKTNDLLHATIAGAKFMLFLSEIEGFGFPPIEAMQLGVPVICSNISSLPEVTLDAAIHVSPYKYDEVADAMIKLQNDELLRKEMISRGYSNTERFTRDKTIKQYIKVFESVSL